jgi:hypothetical protein
MHRHELKYGGRFPQALVQRYAASLSKARRPGQSASKRVRGVARNELLPFVPPEDWHETTGNGKGYRIVVQQPGRGFRHVLTPEDVRARLAQFPKHMLANLEVVQFSHMTRKKQSFPCYGMQWGTSLYLYPIEESLIERYPCPPTPNQLNEARMYGGRWVPDVPHGWRLEWTEETIRDFYLNNILIHELGHLVDDRNTGYVDRERYAEWFALEYGYKRSHSLRPARKVVRRHHKRGRLRSA